VGRVQALKLGGRHVIGDHVHGASLPESAGPHAPTSGQDMIKRAVVQEI
jgi:hypothetical protein